MSVGGDEGCSSIEPDVRKPSHKGTVFEPTKPVVTKSALMNASNSCSNATSASDVHYAVLHVWQAGKSLDSAHLSHHSHANKLL